MPNHTILKGSTPRVIRTQAGREEFDEMGPTQLSRQCRDYLSPVGSTLLPEQEEQGVPRRKT